jgi:pimeloyl-ACP methyl ester carboxylesterase
MRPLALALPLALACAPGTDDRPAADLATPIDTGRVAVAGGSLFYEGAGTGAPVILLHGGNLDRRMWDAEFDFLRRHHRVIRYDARGYGRSGPADVPFAAHDDLLALMRALQVSRASLVGLSLGGRIAIDFSLAHPAMVDRLVLAAPGISGGTWAEDADTLWMVAARRAAERQDSVGVALAWLGSAYIRTALRDSAMAARVREIVVDNADFWAGIVRHRDLEREAVPPAAGRLAELRSPILLLVGSEDTPFIHDVARAIATQAPNVRRIDLPGIGHMVNLEAPVRFREEVAAFLAR